jgi:hypothetical protein
VLKNKGQGQIQVQCGCVRSIRKSLKGGALSKMPQTQLYGNDFSIAHNRKYNPNITNLTHDQEIALQNQEYEIWLRKQLNQEKKLSSLSVPVSSSIPNIYLLRIKRVEKIVLKPNENTKNYLKLSNNKFVKFTDFRNSKIDDLYNFINDKNIKIPILDTDSFKPEEFIKNSNDITLTKITDYEIQFYYQNHLFNIEPISLSVPEFQFFINTQGKNNENTLQISLGEKNSRVYNVFVNVYEDENTLLYYNKNLEIFKSKYYKTFFFIKINRKDLNYQDIIIEDIIIEDISWYKTIVNDLNDLNKPLSHKSFFSTSSSIPLKQNVLNSQETQYNLFTSTNLGKNVREYLKPSKQPTSTTTITETTDTTETTEDSILQLKKIDNFLKLKKKGNITKETKIFTCLDLDIDHTKLIIEEFTNDDKTEYLILGYPHKDMKSYLELYKQNESQFNEIYEDHKTNFMLYMAQLYNQFDFNTDKINITDNKKLKDDIHKFYDYKNFYKYTYNFYNNLLLEEREILQEYIENNNTEKLTEIQQDFFDLTIEQLHSYEPTQIDNKLIINKYFLNKYDKSYQEYFKFHYKIPFDPNFKQKFRDLQKTFYNEMANKFLNKPMMNIKYIFLILKKDIDGNYVPALFNLREFEKKKHLKILEKVQDLINKELPKLYGILNEDEEEYNLFFSYIPYGNVFHIKTEYFHTMANIQKQAYKYKFMILLPELIYMLSINDNLLKLKVEYEKKEFKFLSYNAIETEINTIESSLRKKHVNNSKDKKLLLSSQKLTTLTTFLQDLKDKECNILLLFIESGKIYNFYYKKDNKFYSIKLIPNLKQIGKSEYFKSQNFKQKLSQIINFNTNKDKIYFEVMQDTTLSLYNVEIPTEIKELDYKKIMRFNPVLIKQIVKLVTEQKINIINFFNSPLLSNIDFIKTLLINNQQISHISNKNIVLELLVLLNKFLTNLDTEKGILDLSKKLFVEELEIEIKNIKQILENITFYLQSNENKNYTFQTNLTQTSGIVSNNKSELNILGSNKNMQLLNINLEDYINYIKQNSINLAKLKLKKENIFKNLIQIIPYKIPNPYSKKIYLIRNILATKQYRDEHEKFMVKYNEDPNNEYESIYISDTKLIHVLDSNNIYYFFGKKVVISLNKIYFNPKNCKFNLIELIYIDKEIERILIWVVPINATYSNNLIDENNIENITYIHNFLGLNKYHIKIFKFIKKEYCDNTKNCFVNMISILQQNSLHIHIINKQQIKETIVTSEQGIRFEKMLDITKIINNLENNENYYNNYTLEIFMHDKI